jgi:hypothetical protein
VAPIRVPVLLDPGCAGSFAAWPLTGTHRRLCLHSSSHAVSSIGGRFPSTKNTCYVMVSTSFWN